jgi:hypothetical protein
MLHTRRKAEIEILSTAKRYRPRQAPVLLSASGIDARESSPLLDYLLDKIADFVDVCVDA